MASEVMPSVEHPAIEILIDRAETRTAARQRERAMKRSAPPAQPNGPGDVQMVPIVRPRRHRLTADDYRIEMADRFATWNDVARSSEAA